ncbi:5'-methylthioribulose-1-phosphate dehydratase [Schizosaccharomyces japonicus yFS275]|uniref:Methylthioribulose-1-phosphate dehydratase n=1 Tax=Schizosaccharomyces japonicus (strain yFS275 / FY16936) TaxID=402676 RepID=MTNB_SCHJY|nr:5'-methylthioribulose-1-phosphate dehydratase [Schizosaccharomyces japonicus yFS275]B6K0X1.1 RecName: Full=Methylthioribulose-1-phosphate dehydratase; Short=MTRu-1-P dehydratase [Schizosaccharomyces japonicus yFS275]EEB07592.1 5'-methylthioribulose-1-phosphate dehydratase [Schizosaccharomyces japonicus yFS275]
MAAAKEKSDVLVNNEIHNCAELICSICRQLYKSGWVTGTGGGITIRTGDHIVIAPSGVQKEKLEVKDMFVMSLTTRDYLHTPKQNSKPSQCTPLFLSVYTSRDAYACIHTHSQEAVLLSNLFAQKTHFESSGFDVQRYIPRGSKKNGFYKFEDTIRIPFINNTAHESDLQSNLQKAINENPYTCAVIVRNHGIYAWGDSWEDAKMNTEAVEYLFHVFLRDYRIKHSKNCRFF